MGRPTLLLLLPAALREELFTAGALEVLDGSCHVILNDKDRNWTAEELAQAIGHVEVLVTGWGSPKVTKEQLDRAPNLRLVAHSAGSIKALIDPSAFDREVRVTTAAGAIAGAVADFSLLLIMLGLRHAHQYDRSMRAGRWDGQREHGAGREIGSQTVGVIGAGYVGRESIRLLRPLVRELLVADPYLEEEEARSLGVEPVSLEELFRRCTVITNHAPSTPETHHMVGAGHLASMPDGALLVNTARSWSIDQKALFRELETGRISAALDVFDQEPLAPESSLRELDNVILTPHVAGATVEARLRQGDLIAAEVARFCAGEQLRYEVTRGKLEIMA